MIELEDVTPEGSFVPVFLDSTTLVEPEGEGPVPSGPPPRSAAFTSGLSKLMDLGLTEEEALALVGGSPAASETPNPPSPHP